MATLALLMVYIQDMTSKSSVDVELSKLSIDFSHLSLEDAKPLEENDTTYKGSKVARINRTRTQISSYANASPFAWN